MIEDLIKSISNGGAPKTTGMYFSEQEINSIRLAIEKRKEVEDLYQKYRYDDYFKYCIEARKI